jgi:hypothetical protein
MTNVACLLCSFSISTSSTSTSTPCVPGPGPCLHLHLRRDAAASDRPGAAGHPQSQPWGCADLDRVRIDEPLMVRRWRAPWAPPPRGRPCREGGGGVQPAARRAGDRRRPVTPERGRRSARAERRVRGCSPMRQPTAAVAPFGHGQPAKRGGEPVVHHCNGVGEGYGGGAPHTWAGWLGG